MTPDDLPRLSVAASVVEAIVQDLTERLLARPRRAVAEGTLHGDDALVLVGRLLGLRDVLVELDAIGKRFATPRS